MRKLLFALVVMIATIGTLTSCDSEGAIAFDSLPTAAQTTINSYFGDREVLLISYEKEFLNHEYTVLFMDGTVIEFDKDGAWDSIDAETSGVPTGVLPSKIATYLETNHEGRMVTSIEKETRGYEVEIENLFDLEFDSSGNFTTVDV